MFAIHNQGALRDTTQMSILLLGRITESLARRLDAHGIPKA